MKVLIDRSLLLSDPEVIQFVAAGKGFEAMHALVDCKKVQYILCKLHEYDLTQDKTMLQVDLSLTTKFVYIYVQSYKSFE